MLKARMNSHIVKEGQELLVDAYFFKFIIFCKEFFMNREFI